MKIHIVQLGDTLWKLAEEYNASFEELKKVNSHLANPEKLMPGMKIKIPGSKKTVQKSNAKKEQTTPVAGKKEAAQPSSKEKQKTVQKKEESKAEHPYKPKSPTPMAVLKEDDQKEKKKEQFEAVMPKMPQAPAMPILEKETKTKQKQVTMKEPPKPDKPKQETYTPEKKQQLPSMETPQMQPAPPVELPCEPVAFFPPMMPIYYMPCPPMPQMHPYPVQPEMQQGFPVMPPSGGCGCGGQNHAQPLQNHFHQMPAGFYGESPGMAQQPAQEMNYREQQPVQQPVHPAPDSRSYDIHPAAEQTQASHQHPDNASLPPYHSNKMPTSASFMHAPAELQQPTGSQQYFQPGQTALPHTPKERSFYPKPPFFPEYSDDNHESNR